LNATPAKQPQPQCSRIQQANKGVLDTEQGGALRGLCTIMPFKQTKGQFTSYLLNTCCKPSGKIAESISSKATAALLSMPAMSWLA
jgi:hypothetical protein